MILKKYLYAALAVVSAIALAACSDDEGTDPGHDSAPAVTIYSYTPGSGYNADEDVKIRIAPNSKVKDIYYLSELTTAKQEYVAENGENAYADYVVENGTKIESEDDADPEVTLTGLLGNYTITVVGLAGNGKKAVGSTTFQGLTWTTITGGTMTYGKLGQMGLGPNHVELQSCDSDDTLFRFKDMYGSGLHLKFSFYGTNQTEDESGNIYHYCRVAQQDTGLSVNPYGAISVIDAGYYQKDDSYVMGQGFDNLFCTEGQNKNRVSLSNFYVVSVGLLGYDPDVFVPDAN